MSQPALHPALAALASKYALDADLRRDGRLTLTIDGVHRVHCLAASGGSLLLEARVCRIPADPLRRREALERAMKVAGARVQGQRDGVALNAEGDSLLLQQTLAADADLYALENELGEFVNSLVVWKAAMQGMGQ
ncbi:CesT family type III secretion system chaperone [Chitinimonas lacunae]|uniref:CesT family type III secretion system chaperone n=1 Tax=Chitinimonas lacunae TaxID=1963018 RepID=A0ABV8MPR8_9NEIS